MSEREVVVRLRADISAYSRDLKIAAAETQAFGRSTDRLGGSGGPLQKTEMQSKRTGAEIDKLSGRLRVMTDLALIGAPALTAMGAGAIGGIVALSAEMGAAAGAIGVTVLAVKGLGKGLAALDAYQLDPTTQNLAKLNAEMDKLGPSGERFVRFLDSIEPDLKSLQMAARDGLLPGAEESIDALLQRLPELRSLIRSIATETGTLASEAGGVIGGNKADAFFNYLKTDGITILDNTAKTAGNLAGVLANLFTGFGGMSTDFSGGLLKFSQGLEKATENLDSDTGFQEFVDYIETQGPHALETLGSIGDAVLQIVEATAPLGGPVLTVLGKVADIFAAIADSDLGTPIFAGLAAMALFNRSMLLGQKLSAMTFGGPGVTMVRGYAAGLRQVITAQDRATMSAKELAAAEAQQNKNLAGFASAGKGIALIAGLTLANSDYVESAGLSNTATLAVAGSMGGPLGTALGAAAGFTLDLRHANDDLNDSLKAMDLAGASGDVDAYGTSIANAADQFNKLNEQQGFSSLFTFGGAAKMAKGTLTQQFDQLTGKTHDAADALEAADVEQRKMAAGAAGTFNPVHALASAIGDAAAAAQQEATDLQDATDAMQAQRQEALRSVNAHLNYRAAILDANEALKKNGKTVDENTAAGEENLSKLYALADGWNQQSNAAKNAAGSLADARHNFIDTAEAMGMASDKAHLLANRLFEIPPKRKTQIELDGADQAITTVKTLKQILDSLHSKDINVALHYQTIGNKPHAPTPGIDGGADGMTVPGTRHPYGDKILIAAAPGEEVTGNRYGQADHFRRELKKMNAWRPGMGDGGTVGRGHPDDAGLNTPLFRGEGPRFYQAAFAHNSPFSVAPEDPAWPYQTVLTRALERAMEKWVDDWNIPFDPSSKLTDYDMRGFYKKHRPKSWHEGDHFPDKWKTPYDTRYSAESMYATADCPFHWHGDKLRDDRNGQLIAMSDGGVVPGPRAPYRDSVHILAAPGERFISNRRGQADKHAGLLDAINADRMADGGRVGGGTYTSMLAGGSGDKATSPGIQIWTSGVYSVQKALAALKAELAASVKSIAAERKSRDDLISQASAFGSSVGGAYSKADLFSGGLTEFDTGLQANTNDTNAAQSALGTASSHGLDGPLYQALAASGNLSLLQEFAALSSDQIQQRELQFAGQSNAQSALGSSAQDAAGFTQAIKDATHEIRESSQERKQLSGAVKTLEAQVKQIGDRVESGARKGVGDREKRTATRVRTG